MRQGTGCFRCCLFCYKPFRSVSGPVILGCVAIGNPEVLCGFYRNNRRGFFLLLPESSESRKAPQSCSPIILSKVIAKRRKGWRDFGRTTPGNGLHRSRVVPRTQDTGAQQNPRRTGKCHLPRRIQGMVCCETIHFRKINRLYYLEQF